MQQLQNHYQTTDMVVNNGTIVTRLTVLPNYRAYTVTEAFKDWWALMYCQHRILNIQPINADTLRITYKYCSPLDRI